MFCVIQILQSSVLYIKELFARRKEAWMTKKVSCCLILAILGFSLYLVQPQDLPAQEKELTASDVVALHLKSIGKPELLAKVTSRGLSGKAAVQFIQGGTGQVTNGQFLCVSEGQKVGIKLAFPDINYPGEYFAFDGKQTTVGYIKPGVKSPIADFVFRYNALMKEGFLGGVFSTAWPLLKAEETKPEMQYKQEKVGEVSYHVLEFAAKKTLGDLKVKLFFEPKTFHHIRTEYRVRLSNDMTDLLGVVPGTGPQNSSASSSDISGRTKPDSRAPTATINKSQADTIYVLTEKFDNFANVNGLVLPQDYNIDYSQEGNQASFLARWAVIVEHWLNNGKVDQSFFVAQK
jgi:hypothetical protein